MVDIEFEPTQSVEELRRMAEEKKKELAALREQTKIVEKKIKEEKKHKPKVIKIRVGGPLPETLVNKAKDVAFWHETTLTDLLEAGLEWAVSQYGDVPPREGDLKRGRRKEEVEVND